METPTLSLWCLEHSNDIVKWHFHKDEHEYWAVYEDI